MRLWLLRQKILGARVRVVQIHCCMTYTYWKMIRGRRNEKARPAEFSSNLIRILKLSVLNLASGACSSTMGGGAFCYGRAECEDLICSRWHCFTKATQGIGLVRRAILWFLSSWNAKASSAVNCELK
jgi:hypothetical protein